MLLRRAALGYLVAFPLLGIIILLGPAILAQTINQVVAADGVRPPPEVVGPIGGFGLLGVLALWVMADLLRRIAVAPRPTATVFSGVR